MDAYTERNKKECSKGGEVIKEKEGSGLLNFLRAIN
jgi:hypothetical protein